MKLRRFADMNESETNEGVRKNYGRDGFSKYPFQMYYQSKNVGANAVGAKTVKELVDNVAKKENVKTFAIFKSGQGFHSTTQDEFLVGWYDETDSSYWFNRAQKEPKIMKLRIKSLTENEETICETANNKSVPEVKFKRWNCIVEYGKYDNDRTAIELIDKKTGEPVLVATVNVPDAKLADDEVIIKTHSGNEGIVEVLTKAGIIGQPERYVQTGYVEAPVCKLLVDPGK